MKVNYYPGCTLRNKAKELDRYARECAEILGFTLCENEDWQCCGGAFTSANDEIATKLSSVRVLRDAYFSNAPLITVCAACHNVIKRTNLAMQNQEFANKVNNYMAQDSDFKVPYNGEAKVYHYLEFLRDEIGFDKIKEKVTNALSGRKIAAYYGCLLLRPSKAMQFDDAENPTILESFIKSLGADAVIYPERNECCGGYMAIEDQNAAKKRSLSILDSAKNHGAECIVTACPLCKYNLEKVSDIPVVYFTELLAEAFGVKEVNND